MCKVVGAKAKLPMSRSELSSFIAHLSVSGKAAATIASYVSGLSFIHKSKDLDDPADCVLVRKMIEGCRRDNPSRPDMRRPLTFTMLKAAFSGLKSVCSNLYEVSLFQAALLLAFFGFLRISEFTAISKNKSADKGLQLDDVLITNRGHELCIKYSKTDQRGLSTTPIIPESKTEELCPVNALCQYLDMRKQDQGQLFRHFDKSPLTRYQFAALLKKALVLMHVQTENIKSHRFA